MEAPLDLFQWRQISRRIKREKKFPELWEAITIFFGRGAAAWGHLQNQEVFRSFSKSTLVRHFFFFKAGNTFICVGVLLRYVRQQNRARCWNYPISVNKLIFNPISFNDENRKKQTCTTQLLSVFQHSWFTSESIMTEEPMNALWYLIGRVENLGRSAVFTSYAVTMMTRDR